MQDPNVQDLMPQLQSLFPNVDPGRIYKIIETNFSKSLE